MQLAVSQNGVEVFERRPQNITIFYVYRFRPSHSCSVSGPEGTCRAARNLTFTSSEISFAPAYAELTRILHLGV
jgi:hypothetical protein